MREQARQLLMIFRLHIRSILPVLIIATHYILTFSYGGADKLLMNYIPLGKRAQRVGWAVIVITQLFLLGKLAVMMIRKELFIYSAI